MTTANPEDTALVPAVRRSRSPLPVTPWLRAVREALDRPLTSYYLLLGATALLLTIGLVMVLSASSVKSYTQFGDSYTMVRRQALWVLIGLPVAFAASRMSTRWIRRFVWAAYVVSLALLALVAVMGQAKNGNQNWLGVGPIAIQPSEIAKLSLILWAANVYANKERRLASLHHLIIPVVPGMLLATFLVIAGRDLGTGLVLFAIMLGMLWMAGAPARLFGLCLSIVTVAAFGLATVDKERVARLTSFFDPFKDFQGNGWQAGHGLYALSSGGLFGEGIGASTQKWGSNLPAAHTDFIFAVLGEELGLVGTLLVIGLFLTIAYAALRVALQTADPFVRYVTFGVVVWLIGQMIINIGMVLALLPVIGIPLPLVSYGGSALLPTLAALGLVIGFARREPEAARALAARRKARSAGLSASR
ncbi:cell division protein FtsW [Nocardioides terrae]|uniref:Probable peptidoglycan glycosyltransferase FtsW n=1 Tax=Nocardioides terrae TaxID=574651 RepID=A0A1I1G056_9ACTN|nr:putative lipid II flippase FtsW [Nocardioides terrae]SFC04686.1 cell division protein FtsW [Nocardioides terrae]